MYSCTAQVNHQKNHRDFFPSKYKGGGDNGCSFPAADDIINLMIFNSACRAKFKIKNLQSPWFGITINKMVVVNFVAAFYTV